MHIISRSGVNIAILDGTEDIGELLNIDGERSPINDEIFDLDSWHFDEAVCYLLGIYSNHSDGNVPGFPSLDFITTLESLSYSCSSSSLLFFRELSRRFDRVRKLWIGGSHKERNPIKYYIDWAISKKIDVPWLGYAIQKGFYKLDKTTSGQLASNAKAQNNLYRIIGALKDVLTYYPLGENGEKVFKSQAKLIAFLEEKCSDVPGVSKSNLEEVFKLANQMKE